MANIPIQHQQTFPLSLLTFLLRAKKPMAGRMKGRRKGILCHNQEDSSKVNDINSLTANTNRLATAISSLTAIYPQFQGYREQPSKSQECAFHA